MATEATVFDCELRKRAGTGGSRAVRRDGWVPAVLYGGGEGPANIKLRYNQVLKAYQTGRLIDVLSKISVDGKEQQVIGKEIQVDPVKDLPMHVDMMRVDARTRVTVAVPVHFVGDETSPGLKSGGTLNVVRHEIEVEAPATEIPEFFEVDLAAAEIGDVIHVSTVSLPKGVELTITDRDFTIATIIAPRAVTAADDEDETPDTQVTEGPAGAEIEGDEE
ncbi:50S ribosomal protein L25/general stress protein Ctc [Parvularcula dongshanensis]|uniref:Large ribosomal subunit protein bL25 n=1 Tax=Parvularcula dongshanensis TaxID=1173995 RepID=A0A840I440_9PROT|nr:50S ribosomal protein L25/general stress protein Ctc [Parvularcula dongshanensis]MBB4658964.1 large subunit ribosomal protein L25 [Parvularcula dongshanensis]